MNVHCPKCDHPLEFPQADEEHTNSGFESVSSVSCPNCGLVPVQLPLEPTVTFPQIEDERKNTRVGHFLLVKLLGQGSFGDVWLADDVSLGRQVALKLPRPHVQELDHLMFEAKTAASLRHPNIVSIYEV